MNAVTLYHGSDEYVTNPKLYKSMPNCDFGPGFYTTTNFQQARDWAFKKMKNRNGSRYYVSEYLFTPYNANLNIKKFDKPTAEWMELVYNGRHGMQADFDVLIGPVADSNISDLIDEIDDKLFELNANFVSMHQIRSDRHKIFEEYAKKAVPPSFEKYDQSVFITEESLKYLHFQDGRGWGEDNKLVHTYKLGELESLDLGKGGRK